MSTPFNVLPNNEWKYSDSIVDSECNATWTSHTSINVDSIMLTVPIYSKVMYWNLSVWKINLHYLMDFSADISNLHLSKVFCIFPLVKLAKSSTFFKRYSWMVLPNWALQANFTHTQRKTNWIFANANFRKYIEFHFGFSPEFSFR